MHIFLTCISIYSVWHRKDYLKWRDFYPTMQYIAIGNLTYQFLCATNWLWRIAPDMKGFYYLTVEAIYSFIVFPLTALMFLSRYPEGSKKMEIFKHYLFWIGIYVFFEFIFMKLGIMEYQKGWNLWWSALFNCIMFPFLRLHHKKTILTLVLSVPMTLFWLWLFDIPVHLPIEKR